MSDEKCLGLVHGLARRGQGRLGMVVTGAKAGLSCLFLSQNCGTEGRRRTRTVLVAEIRGVLEKHNPEAARRHVNGCLWYRLCRFAPPLFPPMGAFLRTVCVYGKVRIPLEAFPLSELQAGSLAQSSVW